MAFSYPSSSSSVSSVCHSASLLPPYLRSSSTLHLRDLLFAKPGIFPARGRSRGCVVVDWNLGESRRSTQTCLRQHRERTEYKYVAQKDRLATLAFGLLRRRLIIIDRSVAMSKESRLAEEAAVGAIPAEAMDTIYKAAKGRSVTTIHELRELQSVLPILRRLPHSGWQSGLRYQENPRILSAILRGCKRQGLLLGHACGLLCTRSSTCLS